jgi:hypothetical protein
MSWPALQWAFDCDKTETSAERLVLLQFANHADDRGYTWPSVEFIGSVCHLHRDTVAGAIEALIAKKAVFRTKKRRGSTGQVKVYRMPKCTYESHLKTGTFEKGQSVVKAPGKVGESTIRLGTNRVNRVTSNHITRVIATKVSERATAPSTPARDYSLSGEKDLLDSLTRMLGSREMKNNGGMWRLRIRSGKDHRKALRNALDDFAVKTPDQEGKIQNRGAWLTDKYERCLKEIQCSKI